MQLDHARTRLFHLSLPVVLGLWLCAPIQGAQFHVTLGSESKSSGSRIRIPIVVTAEKTVGAAQLELQYDPSRLRWVGGEAGELTANTLVDANLLEPGRVKIAFAGGEDVHGTGALYLPEFEWMDSQPGTTPIKFAGVRAWDQSTGLELATSAAAGEIAPVMATPALPETIDQPSAPRPLAPSRFLIFATLVAATMCLVILALLLRRRTVAH